MDLSSIFKFLPPQMMQQMESFLNFIRQQAITVVNKQAEIDTRLVSIEEDHRMMMEALHRIEEYITGGIPAAPTDYTIEPIASLPPMLNEETEYERHIRAGSLDSAPGSCTGNGEQFYGDRGPIYRSPSDFI